jgi:hypothetical protein
MSQVLQLQQLKDDEIETELLMASATSFSMCSIKTE